MNKVMINKGLETTQHLMLLQVSCVSSSHLTEFMTFKKLGGIFIKVINSVRYLIKIPFRSAIVV